MDCFGDSSSEEEQENHETARDESCGVCCFHQNTETSLLAHVRNSLKPSPTTNHSVDDYDDDAVVQRASDVLHAIDSFCLSRHWMMHIGPEKGGILIGALSEAMSNKMKLSSSGQNIEPFIVVELGTYCGYASILMGKAMYQARRSATMNCHLFTTEINRSYAEIATEIIQLSGLSDMISVHQISYDGFDTDMVNVVRGALEEYNQSQNNHQATPNIDFLFIDHDKDSYKSDLCRLEASGMICHRTRVVADNVIFAGIDEYVSYVQQRKKAGIVETRTVPSKVEYSGGGVQDSVEYEDGIEITDYLQNP